MWVAAYTNSVLLLAILAVVVVEATARLVNPKPIDVKAVATVGSLALAANLISTLILHGEVGRSLNIRSAYLHLLSDTMSSAVVIVGALLVRYTGLYIVDPLASIFIVVYVAREALRVAVRSAEILMEASPANLELIVREIRGVEGVRDVHHCHVWRLDEHSVLVGCHVEVEDMPLTKAQRIIDEIEARLEKLGINMSQYSWSRVDAGKTRVSAGLQLA